MTCHVQQRDCPSCQTTSNTCGVRTARDYREAKRARIDLTEAALIRTRIAHGMLMNDLDASRKTNQKLEDQLKNLQAANVKLRTATDREHE